MLSLNELAAAKARLDQAKAELAMAKFHLSATDIKAIFRNYRQNT
jgi:membrane fusion protein (multidrug efflux system)